MFNKPSDSLILFSSCPYESTYLLTNERKEKRRTKVKEFNDELLNLVAIEDKSDKNNIFGEQQHVEIDKLDFEVLDIDGLIKDL